MMNSDGDSPTPSVLLRGLNDIACMPLLSEALSVQSRLRGFPQRNIRTTPPKRTQARRRDRMGHQCGPHVGWPTLALPSMSLLRSDDAPTGLAHGECRSGSHGKGTGSRQ